MMYMPAGVLGQVLGAVSRCGRGGQIVLQGGAYNITRKMTWELVDARVDLHGMLSVSVNPPSLRSLVLLFFFFFFGLSRGKREKGGALILVVLC